MSLNKAILEELYLTEQLPMHKIAENLNVSVGTVFNYCKKYSIPTRSKSDTFNFKGRKHSEQVCENISKTHKGKIVSAETRTKIAEGHKLSGIGHKKLRSDGYISIYFPDHPKSSKDGYVMEHVLIMECVLGRRIADNEIVHHKNAIKTDNKVSNLEVMTASEHMSYHSKKRWEEKRNGQ